MKLNGTHPLLVYADDVNLFGGSMYAYIHTIKKNTKAVLDASKKIGIEVNVEKMSHEHNAEHNHNI
jgi:hypothetical protein